VILSLCKLKKAEVLVRHLALHLASFIFLYTENNLLTLFLEIKPLSRGTYTYIYIYIYVYNTNCNKRKESYYKYNFECSVHFSLSNSLLVMPNNGLNRCVLTMYQIILPLIECVALSVYPDPFSGPVLA
jgi:hypothetical protein